MTPVQYNSIVSLEKVAEDSARVFMDTNVISNAQNRVETSIDLCKYLGHGLRLHDVRSSLIKCHIEHVSALLDITRRYNHIRATLGVISELGKVQQHYDHTAQYYARGKKGVWGEKMRLLHTLRTVHGELFQLLRVRSSVYEDAQKLKNYLVKHSMHTPRMNFHVKGRLKDSTDAADAELVAYSICEALNVSEKGEPVAIVSEDADICNLVANFEEEYHSRRLPFKEMFYAWTLQSQIHMYRPCVEGWRREFKVNREIVVRTLDVETMQVNKE